MLFFSQRYWKQLKKDRKAILHGKPHVLMPEGWVEVIVSPAKNPYNPQIK